MPAGLVLAPRRGVGTESGKEDGWIQNCLQFMGLCDSCCSKAPRNDTTTSGAEINLSQQEKDKTNHPLQESHSGPVGKSPGMNGFCKGHTSSGFSPFSLCSCKLRSIRWGVEAILGCFWQHSSPYKTPGSSGLRGVGAGWNSELE